jgi:hypothetical protein
MTEREQREYRWAWILRDAALAYWAGRDKAEAEGYEDYLGAERYAITHIVFGILLQDRNAEPGAVVGSVMGALGGKCNPATAREIVEMFTHD